MNWDDFYKSFEQAQNTQRQADRIATQMANMVAGRLQSCEVNHGALCKLKRELENYNMHTGKWKP